MNIDRIESIHQDDSGVVYVTAVIDEVLLMYHQTLYDPPEYGPALCEASFELSEDEYLPDNEYELIEFLDDLDLDWNVVDCSDDGYEFFD